MFPRLLNILKMGLAGRIRKFGLAEYELGGVFGEVGGVRRAMISAVVMALLV
jgi:hypothetical protein